MLGHVSAAAIDLYAAAFLAQCQATPGPGWREIAEPGLHGVLSTNGEPHVRLLVSDDQAHGLLAGLVPDVQHGGIRTFGTAARCARLVSRRLGWGSDNVTAMVSSDLSAVPSRSLPNELTLAPVRRMPEDDLGGVALTDAVAAAVNAAPSIKDPPEGLADYLRSLPSTFRLFAAVDGDGVVRATSGSGVFGDHATVIFVNTDPGWRGRGIGQAMTAHALHAARRAGARCAALDASEAGRRIYLRLGFDSAGSLTRFRSTI